MPPSIVQQVDAGPVNRVAQFYERTPANREKPEVAETAPVQAKKFSIGAAASSLLRMVILALLVVVALVVIGSALIPGVFVALVLLLVPLGPVIAVAVALLLTREMDLPQE